MDSWSDILRAGDILGREGLKIDFDPTRHGITRGTPIYFFGPNGNRGQRAPQHVCNLTVCGPGLTPCLTGAIAVLYR
ncbi:MAG: hypothetical protein AB1671_20425 [Thermodesulfobacteriota bacterium]